MPLACSHEKAMGRGVRCRSRGSRWQRHSPGPWHLLAAFFFHQKEEVAGAASVQRHNGSLVSDAKATCLTSRH